MPDFQTTQEAFQAWLRALKLSSDAARTFLTRADEESKRELEGLLAAESKQRAQFAALVNTGEKQQ